MIKTIIAMISCCSLIFVTGMVSAAPIIITISDPSAGVVFGGTAQDVDLEITFTADTTAHMNGTLPLSGSGYTNVMLTYTSAALGLTNAPGTELWDFSYSINTGGGDNFGLFDAGTFNGVGDNGFAGALLAWDGVSDLGPIGPATGFGSSFNSGDPTDTISGTAFVLDHFAVVAGNPGVTFTARVVPVPSAAILFATGLAALIGWNYRKTRS